MHSSGNIIALFCSVLWCLMPLFVVATKFPFSKFTDPFLIFLCRSEAFLTCDYSVLTIRAEIPEVSRLRLFRKWNHYSHPMTEEDPLQCLMRQTESMVQCRAGSVPQGEQDTALRPAPLCRKGFLLTTIVSSGRQNINSIVLGCLLLIRDWKAIKLIKKIVFNTDGANSVISTHLQNYTHLWQCRIIDGCMGCT